MKIWWLKHEISKRKPCKPLSATKSVCVSKNRLISTLPWLSTWATAWRCPRVVHTAALCLRCRRTGRSVCPAGRGSRRASGCSSASDPVKSEPEYLGLSQQEKEEYSPILVKCDEAYLLSDQQGWTLQRDGHHLVRVPCYWISSEVNKDKPTLRYFKSSSASNTNLKRKSHLPLDSVQLPPVSPGHEETSSPRSL